MDCQRSTCLICRSIISTSTTTTNISRVNNTDALFLLQIIFEIPAGSYLLNTLKDEKLNIIKMCDHCYSLSRTCTEIYCQIGQLVEKFCEVKSKIIKGSTSSSSTLKSGASKTDNDQNDDWSSQFRTFIKHNEFSKSKFPFVVQDFDNLVKFDHLTTEPLTNCPTIKTEDLVKNMEHVNDNPLEGPSTSVSVPIIVQQLNPAHLTTKPEVKTGNDVDDLVKCGGGESDISSDFEFIATPFNPDEWKAASKKNKLDLKNLENDDSSSHEDTPVWGNPYKKSKLKYGLTRNPKTLRYDCLEKSCETSSVSSAYIIKHYEAAHLKIKKRKIFRCEWEGCGRSSVCKTYIRKHYEVDHLKTKEKERFPCEWRGCGKLCSDQAHLDAHMDQHKGTPRWKCGKCGKRFYWRKYWFGHVKKKVCCNQSGRRRRGGNDDGFDCSWPGCGKRFGDKGVWMCHMSRHKGTPGYKGK